MKLYLEAYDPNRLDRLARTMLNSFMDDLWDSDLTLLECWKVRKEKLINRDWEPFVMEVLSRIDNFVPQELQQCEKIIAGLEEKEREKGNQSSKNLKSSKEPEWVNDLTHDVWLNVKEEYENKNDLDVEVTSKGKPKKISDTEYKVKLHVQIEFEEDGEWITDESYDFEVIYNIETGEFEAL